MFDPFEGMGEGPQKPNDDEMKEIIGRIQDADGNMDKEALRAVVVEAREEVLAMLEDLSEKWMGDSPNDAIARAIIAGCRPLIDALTDAAGKEGVQPLIFMLSVKQFQEISANLSMLDKLTQLKGDS